jgi:hypothetical protein
MLIKKRRKEYPFLMLSLGNLPQDTKLEAKIHGVKPCNKAP